jgi:hypothetical protein
VTLTARESFIVQLAHGPHLRANAIVVLAGEDGEARADAALNLYLQGAAPCIVLSGALNEAPALHGAQWLRARMLAKGLADDVLIVENESRNTREQAQQVVALATSKGWTRILLIASAYHSYRAFLTFVQALRETGLHERIHVILGPSPQSKWSEPPPGRERVRADLLHDEWRKIEEYRELGHVASFDDGAGYLDYWERRIA